MELSAAAGSLHHIRIFLVPASERLKQPVSASEMALYRVKRLTSRCHVRGRACGISNTTCTSVTGPGTAGEFQKAREVPKRELGLPLVGHHLPRVGPDPAVAPRPRLSLSQVSVSKIAPLTQTQVLAFPGVCLKALRS